ncbi:MAG: hypothetical protein Q3972_06530 [Corynebacterium sp.]|nr:hypothetical protein [Corynebacterium sp.]
MPHALSRLRYLIPLGVLWPFIALCVTPHGAFLYRDMAVIPAMRLTETSLGLTDSPARATPQDALLGLVGGLQLSTWLMLLILVISAIDAARTIKHPLPLLLLFFNPFVFERLLQGHWSLVMVAWLLPGIIHNANTNASANTQGQALNESTQTARNFWGLWRLWLCSFTPTGLLIGALAWLLFRPRVLIAVVALALVWLIPSLQNAAALHGNAPASIFASHNVLDVLSYGGIWNTELPTHEFLPYFRLVYIPILVITIFLAARLAYRRTLTSRVPFILLGLGLVWTILPILAPDLWNTIIATIPGAGLLRDSSKGSMLILLFSVLTLQDYFSTHHSNGSLEDSFTSTVSATESITAPITASRSVSNTSSTVLAGIAAAAILVVSAGPIMSLGVLKPVNYSGSSFGAHETVFIPGQQLIVRLGADTSGTSRIVVDPRTKETNLLNDTSLRISTSGSENSAGTTADSAVVVTDSRPRYEEAMRIYEAGADTGSVDTDALADLGITLFINPETGERTRIAEPTVKHFWDMGFMALWPFVLWLVLGLCSIFGALLPARRTTQIQESAE